MSKDDDFLRRFAVEIGTALREREDGTAEQQRQNQPSIEESVEDLYRSLVFDEPLIDHIPNLPVVTSALSRQLVLSASSSSASVSSYALSNRLVNGIIYLCNQENTTAVKQKEKQTQPTKGTDNSSNSTRDLNLNENSPLGHSTIKTAMAKLAFCVLVDIPLECCRDNSSSERNLNKIRNFLGSFKGSVSTTTQDKHHEETTATATTTTTTIEDSNCNKYDEEKIDTAGEDIPSSAVSDNNDDTAADDTQQQQQQQKATEELWATESDPSDYDYGEGDSEEVMGADNWLQQQQQHAESDIDWLDPNVLSKPDPNLTLQQTRGAIGTLMQLASYTLLEPIFCLAQKDTSHYVSQLTQLILVLLQPRKNNNGSSSSSSTSENNSILLDSSMNHVILSPLWILRDAATYHTKSTMRKSAASNYEQIYLQILQTLLAMDQAYLQDVGGMTTAAHTQNDLCVSSIVGLSSLSSWCVTQKKPTQVTIDAIVDSMNDLEHVVQRGEQSYKRNLPNTLIPILEILSGIYYDRVNNNATTPYYKGSTISQTMLNSGFLRQILALVATVDDNDEDKTSTDYLGFHHALWGLCIAYPKIVGKYVFRYPGSSQIVRSYAMQLDSSAPQNCVQCILWNIYGWLQCKESSNGGGGGGSGLNILRKPGSSSSSSSKASRKLTQDECSEVCQKAWSRLCQLVKQALQETDSSESDDASVERVIQEWGRLLVLGSISSIATQFKSMVESSLLDDISIVISNQSEQLNERKSKSSNEDGKVDDEKDDKPSRRQKIVSQAHKLLKEYKLFFQGTVVGSSKTD